MTSKQPPNRVLPTVAAIGIVAAVVAVSVFSALFYGSTVTKTVTFTSTVISVTTIKPSSTSCIITGPPGPFYLRVLFDSNQTPVAGALIAATSQPAYCNGSPAANQTTLVFSTNHTEWHNLNTPGVNAAYSIVVGYYGRVFNFTADLRPVSVTCATLYVPSGRTNVTITAFRTGCP